MEVLVSIGGLVLDPVTKMPAVILLNEDRTKRLIIWIGMLEIISIAEGMDEGLKRTTRPMTHDLFKSSLDVLGAKITKIVICDLRENAYYASVSLIGKAGETYNLDSRPSDSIALALRFKCPIYVEEKLLSNVGKSLMVVEPSTEAESEETDLAKMDPTKMHKA